jgi:hypothetical protein
MTSIEETINSFAVLTEIKGEALLCKYRLKQTSDDHIGRTNE